MEETFVPFRGIKNDLKGRLLCYKQDWSGGIGAGIRCVVFGHASNVMHCEKEEMLICVCECCFKEFFDVKSTLFL